MTTESIKNVKEKPEPMKLNLDATDIKILRAMMNDSRMPITKLAKAARASREVVTYRIKRLEKKGIIKDYVTEIDTEKLGYVGAAVFVALKAEREEEFRRYLESNKNICWVGEQFGIWDFGMSILGRTNQEVDYHFAEMYDKFKDMIIDHRLTMHKRNHYFYEKLFQTKVSMKEKKFIIFVADDNDRKILKELALNSREDYVELVKKVPLSAQAIKNRIRRLEQCGYIKRYSLFLDFSKLGVYQYSIFITNKNLDQRKKLVAYLSNHPEVCFICEYIGDQFLEFGIFVDNPYELRKKIQVIEEAFPDNRIIEVSLQKELVSTAPARIVFEKIS